MMTGPDFLQLLTPTGGEQGLSPYKGHKLYVGQLTTVPRPQYPAPGIPVPSSTQLGSQVHWNFASPCSELWKISLGISDLGDS